MWRKNEEKKVIFYKVNLELLRILPMLLAFISMLNTILAYYDIDVPLLSYIGGVSLLPLIFMYLSSYVFKFCEYHRIFLHYILINNILTIYDFYIGIPLSDTHLFEMYLVLTGIFLFIALYLHLHKK